MHELISKNENHSHDEKELKERSFRKIEKLNLKLDIKKTVDNK